MFRFIVVFVFIVFVFPAGAQQIRDTIPYGSVLDENLLIAAYNRDYAKAVQFISKGAKVNIKDYSGVTPLIYAIQNKDLPMVKLLVSKGADVNLKPTNTWDPAPLVVSVKLGYAEIVKHLLDNKGTVSITDHLGATPLHYAALYNDTLIAKILFKYQAAVNDTTLEGETPIYSASFNGSKDVFEILLNNGADLEKSDSRGFTPLMVASQNGHYDIVLRLIQNWAEINRLNKDGFSALSLAIAGGYADIVDLLRLNGANVNEVNTLSFNPRGIAQAFRYKAISDSLKTSGAKPNFVPHFGSLFSQLGIAFNDKDFLTGISLGTRDSKYGLELALRYYFRPSAKPVLIKKGEDTFFQYWERRHRVGISLSKPFTIIDANNVQTGIFLGSGVDMHFGYYRGTKETIRGGIMPSPFLGMFCRGSFFEMNFSAQYTNYGINGLSNWYVAVGVVFHTKNKPWVYYKKLKLVD